MGKYDNTMWTRCAATGGVLSVTIDASNVGQGNGGTSLPCKGCYVQRRDGESLLRLSIGTAATATLGVELGDVGEGAQPLWIPISDISELYFYGTENDVVDIIYLKG